ncbi:TetR/AcrR family transcriptional regulator [Yoonia sp. BS5-3]|uniref:TetR/AcrR family transcriptional regulator n=1 Tax=Yoonia phaeophyticola TaxID=3137369 RepID=A0ABZ2V774_9RHOB
MPDGTIEPKKGRKYDQVLEGARVVFMADGFEGASVDDIARAANVSKATLYSYFPDKRFLFMQVAKTECQRQADLAIASIDVEAPIRQVLHDIASEMVEFITSKFGKQIFRICVGESDRFPELGREFYHSGPILVRTKLIDFFEEGVARGDLKIDDFELAADQFHELAKATLFPKMVCNIVDEFSAEEKERVINGAVDVFLAYYGT